MSEQVVRPDVLGDRLAKIPRLIDMDAHVVEPPARLGLPSWPFQPYRQ
jgi:hypothetical protein